MKTCWCIWCNWINKISVKPWYTDTFIGIYSRLYDSIHINCYIAYCRLIRFVFIAFILLLLFYHTRVVVTCLNIFDWLICMKWFKFVHDCMGKPGNCYCRKCLSPVSDFSVIFLSGRGWGRKNYTLKITSGETTGECDIIQKFCNLIN